jgi:hypothetical protein
MRRAVLIVVAALVVVLVGGTATIEVRHRTVYGHWFGYGWHVDVLTDKAEHGRPGFEHVHYAAVTNFSLLPGYIEGCVPNDPRSHQIPVASSRIETQERSGWKTVSPGWPQECADGRIVRRRLWPLVSFYTEPTFLAYGDRNKGDWVRIVALSSFDNSPGSRGEFVSMPFQITEEPQGCSKGCVSIRSVEFCDPTSTTICRKLEQWRDRPGSPHPPTVDVLCEIQNTGTEVSDGGDFIVLATVDSLIAPTREYGLADLDKMPTTVGWAEERAVKLQVVGWLPHGETRPVRITGFDLRAITKEFDDDPSSLWPWWIRVNLRVENRDGDRLATRSAMLPLIPSDKRLAEKTQEPVDDKDGVQRFIIAPKPRPLW